MMLMEVKFSECSGKTIEAVKYSLLGQAVVTFTDDTFATLGIELGDPATDAQICDDDLNLFDFGDRDLIELGILSRDELEQKRDECNRRDELNRKAASQTEYDRRHTLLGEDIRK